ncbi:hypothetical protein PFISCL1PPCAC_19949 [Pristionchus fissidentatus]|uniref:Elongator complex protein 1 n=1 Tax=Pristionchus fissidentatus TaxID=1538716 RepID=A0AAV5WCB6_9BILA|nr:hypothetical protein PFISCL1PPCAC_19949 [Pristionchus fissidentatus]
MRSVVISSVESTCLSSNDHIIGVETVVDSGVILVSSSTNLLFVEKGEVTRDIRWREMVDRDTVICFGVIEGRAVCIYSSGIVSCIDCESGHVEESIVTTVGIIGGAINSVRGVMALVLNDYTITIIDVLFDVLVEGIDMHTKGTGMDELVTVGWGSEKTQFQGKGGKEQKEKVVESRQANEENTSGCRVEWREDGEIFVVNYYDAEKKERECTIWNGNGELVSRVLGETRIDEWSGFRPKRNTMGVAVDGRVVITEKNGHKRNGDINVQLVVSEGRVMDGGWNIDGSLLALIVEKKKDDATLQYIMFWLCSNFDWSCKLVLPFEGEIPAWRWNSERWNQIMIVSPKNELFQLHLSVNCHSSNGVVCTMGLSSMRLTNLSRVVIPPPMAELSISIECPSALFFSSTNLVVITYSRSLFHYSLVSCLSGRLCCSLVASFPVSLPPNSIISSLSMVDSYYVIGFTLHSIHLLVFYDKNGKEVKNSTTRAAVISVKKEEDGSTTLLYSDASIHNDQNALEDLCDSSLLVDYRFSETGFGMYTLRSSSCLYDNSSLISKGVSSFSYSNPFVAWIDNEFLLHVMDTSSNDTAEVRSVEKGAILVSIASPKVILLMPRGNIETIHSRFFLVRSIRYLLSMGEVKKALVDMRKHGISFTLLKEFDYLFCSSIDWLKDMDDTHLLSLLIMELRSNSEQYCEYCDVLCSSILSLPSSHIIRLFPSLLTSFLLSTPPKTVQSFRLIVEYLPKDASRSSTLHNWLQVCSFYISPSVLFSSSLSTYNLPFVVEVVEALSIDPNEYMDILRELNELDDLSYRAYRMDLLREDWSSALLNLSKCQPTRMEEVIDLLKKRSLHSLALRIYGDGLHSNVHFTTIGDVALTQYCKEGKWREGALVAKNIGDHQREMMCREKMADVDEWLKTLERSLLSDDEKKLKKEEWKNKLIAASKWDTVARLMNEMACDFGERIEIKEKARDWKGIVREVEEGETLNEEKVNRGREILHRRSEEMEKEVNEKVEEIIRLSARLHIVREKKREIMGRMTSGEIGLKDMERCDAFSESSVATSRSSRSSRASTISRRTKKVEKKKQSLKEGGEWEDAAILIACHSHWKSMRQMLEEAVTLMPSLISIRLFSSFYSLSGCLDRLESTLNRLRPLIWPTTILPHLLTGPFSHIYGDGEFSCEGGEGGMPSYISLDPEMNSPSPLSDHEKSWRIIF